MQHLPLRRMRLGLIAAMLLWCAIATADERDKSSDMPVKEALEDDVNEGWIYDNIEKGYARAKQTGKPLLVAFR